MVDSPRPVATAMIREDRELLAELAKLNRMVPSVVLGLMEGTLPADAQAVFGQWLIAIGEVLLTRAEGEDTW
ncbi:MAG: hypothetical protein ACRDRL_03945 [Sciscionella sp.]